MSEQKTIVPALPGYFVVGLFRQPTELSFTPIIAWAIALPDYGVEPIIPPEAFWDEHHGIRYPGGEIVVNEEVFPAGAAAEKVIAAIQAVVDEQERRQASRKKSLVKKIG
jgi:hypothetical protein